MAFERNEGKACDAVIQWQEGRRGSRRCRVRRPEIDRIGPPVELRLSIGGKEFAIEHTVIETFPDQIRFEHNASRIVTTIRESLDGKLPAPGRYLCYLPIDLPSKGKETLAIESNLREWITTKAKEWNRAGTNFKDRASWPHGYKERAEIDITGEGPVAHLWKSVHWAQSEKYDGRLFFQFHVEGDLSALSRTRLKIAFAKKLPKLRECARQGAATLFVLENQDPSLTNLYSVADALDETLGGLDNLPDQVFLVDTTIEESWTIAQLYPRPLADHIEEWEIDPSTLEDLTGRR